MVPEALLKVLADGGVPVSAEELLDILWLARRMPPDAAAPLARAVSRPDDSAHPGSVGERSDGGDSRHSGHRHPRLSRPSTAGNRPAEHTAAHWAARTSTRPHGPEETSGALHAADGAGHQQTSPALPVRIPEGKVLTREELSLSRALRPLKSSRPDPRAWELDERATVTAVAETGLLDPVLRPARTRWLDLVMLVDDGVSMLLWRRLVAEVRQLLERSGAFRTVRVHGLDTRSQRAPRISSHPYIGDDQGAAPTVNATDAAAGSTLVLVMSDGVGTAWQDGRMHTVLARLTRHGPTAVMHTLPEPLRDNSGIHGRLWQVTTRRAGAANHTWQIRDPVLPPELAPFDGLPVPVLEPSAPVVEAWARLVGSAGASERLRLLAPPAPPVPAAPWLDSQDAGYDVLRFRAAATPEAYRLAAHVAAVAPVTVPVMRLIQEVLGDHANTSHLAEVFLGGLMRRTDTGGDRTHPEHRVFDFPEDTRRILLSTVPASELLQTSRALGTRLNELAGRAPDFAAWLAHEHGPGRVSANSRPFTVADERLLRRLGLSAALAHASPPQPPSESRTPYVRGLGGRMRSPISSDRERAIVRATSLLTDHVKDSSPVVVLHGMPGVGKSELAAQVAHRLAPTFWHARIRIDLGGEGFAVSTEAATIELLRAFGQSGDSLPPDSRARRQQLQEHLRAGPSLLVLDNVANAASIVPLLPAAPGSAAILTSRSALPSVYGAARVEVEPLPDAEALRLFESIIGAERVAAERDAANSIVNLLGGLPLAICIAGASLVSRSLSRRPLGAYAALLSDDRQRIAQLEGQLDGEDIGIRSSFESSYRVLREDTRRMFRYLSLLPGTDFVPELAAACAGIEPGEAERLLGELAGRHLLEGAAAERFRLHDLLRQYAREHAERSEPKAERDEAFRRVLEWYATRLDSWMNRPEAHDNPPREAISWFAEEHLNVQAVIRRAYEGHEWELLLRLVDSLYGLLFYRSQWEEMEAVKAMAVEAARARRDESAELRSLIHLAEARRILGRREETAGLYERALEIARAGGDVDKEGWILVHVGDLECDLGRPGDALRRYAEARAIYRQQGDKGAEIWLSAHMADAYQQLDRPEGAARVLTDALEESQRRGDPAEIAWCQWHLALAYDQMGRYAAAEEILAPATEFHRRLGDLAGLARMLTITGDIHFHASRPDLAREAYGEALELVRSLDIPEQVAEVEAALERASG
ncbi:SAV_2336 N-terminal domain-related protein [Streptomyces paradoxus]|uniref:SAV_2336 N-terminal domain-related protein n=1 Tax=Streptomyces paradoxus TaxID=66375 RepID=UPI0036F87FA3